MFAACSGITITLKFCVLCVFSVGVVAFVLPPEPLVCIKDPVESVSSPGSRSKRHLVGLFSSGFFVVV